MLQLRSLVSQVALNKKVDVEVLRDGKPMKVTAEIKEQPVDYLTRAPQQVQPGPQLQPGPQGQPQLRPPNAAPQPDQDNDNQQAGAFSSVRVGELSPDLARQLDLPNGVHGVVVTDVDPDSGIAELQKGDVIEEVNQQPVSSVAEYNKVISSLDANQPQVLSVCRHRVRSFLVVRPR